MHYVPGIRTTSSRCSVLYGVAAAAIPETGIFDIGFMLLCLKIIMHSSFSIIQPCTPSIWSFLSYFSPLKGILWAARNSYFWRVVKLKCKHNDIFGHRQPTDTNSIYVKPDTWADKQNCPLADIARYRVEKNGSLRNNSCQFLWTHMTFFCWAQKGTSLLIDIYIYIFFCNLVKITKKASLKHSYMSHVLYSKSCNTTTWLLS